MTFAPFDIARSGLDAQSMRMRVIANNLANVNTTGFKRERAEFETLGYQVVTAPGATSSGDNRYATGLNLGTGVRVMGTGRLMNAGALQISENPLDLAIEGEGFFQVAQPDGTTAYTRAGNFHLSSEGKVVTGEGRPLQPDIQVPDGAQSITIGADGTVTALVAGSAEPSELGKIEVARFANSAGLQALGNNLYAATSASGTAQTGAPGSEGRGSVRQSALEGSNVNIVQELVDMIETQRAYEVNSKMISSTDEMLRNASQQL
ncbi:MAG: flagellar basal-body rod protein FlgG [Sphingopyxis sp.]